MQQLTRLAAIITISVSLYACSASVKEENAKLNDKKAKLEKLKSEQKTLAADIAKLEAEIKLSDTAFAKSENAKLVSITSLTTSDFVHYIDLQGRVDADNISYISPRLGPGQVKAIYVKKGDYVRKGQLLLRLDDAVQRQAIVAAQQSLETIRTQLAFAKDVYNRQNNLWKQGIGTEVQLISARTNVQTLENQLSSAQANIRTMQTQANAANIYSDVNGVADEVNVRVGEMFTGFIGTMPQIKIVNTSALKAIAQVPENYAGKVRVGSPVIVVLPDIKKSFNSTITLSGKTIDANNRSFNAEARIPADPAIRPNQIAQIRIQDYAVKNTIAIPVNTVQTDEKGKYVFVAVKENNKMVARKKTIGLGELNGDMVEVRVGLTTGDQLVTEGYQNLYDGQVIVMAVK
jgi:membrane fusion protein (multidrug efflux system)